MNGKTRTALYISILCAGFFLVACASHSPFETETDASIEDDIREDGDVDTGGVDEDDADGDVADDVDSGEETGPAHRGKNSDASQEASITKKGASVWRQGPVSPDQEM